MFIVELSYTAPLKQIDEVMKEHMAFVDQGYEAGIFLVSGRKIPRDGGIIIAIGQGREQMEALMQKDPFVARGLATVRVTEFRASQRASDIDARLDKEPTAKSGRASKR